MLFSVLGLWDSTSWRRIFYEHGGYGIWGLGLWDSVFYIFAALIERLVVFERDRWGVEFHLLPSEFHCCYSILYDVALFSLKPMLISFKAFSA